MSVSKRTQFIFDTFYKDKAKAKNKRIIEHYNKYYSSIELSEKFNFRICEVKTMEYVVAYYMDVIKYKESHFYSDINYQEDSKNHLEEIHSKKINFPKVASFSAKWLLKDPPASIFYDKDYIPTDEEEQLVYTANETCVLSYVMEVIDIDFDDKNEIYGDILYHFKFRNFDHRHFILIFTLIEKMYK